MLVMNKFNSWSLILLMLSLLITDVAHMKKAQKARKSSTKQESCKYGLAKEKYGGTLLILQGNDVDPPDRYPWMVSLMDKKTKRKICGGALISRNIVLTAAHCFLTKGVDNLENCTTADRMPSDCWEKPNDTIVGLVTTYRDTFILKRVIRWIPHPKYHINATLADIGLIILSRCVSCLCSRSPVGLPTTPKMAHVGNTVNIAGWGTVNFKTREFSSHLKLAKLKIVSDRQCTQVEGFSGTQSLCATGEGKNSPCVGDSGGPLFIEKSGTHYIVGIASSHSSLTCELDAPIIFTDVYYFLPWIKNHMLKRKKVRNSK